VVQYQILISYEDEDRHPGLWAIAKSTSENSRNRKTRPLVELAKRVGYIIPNTFEKQCRIDSCGLFLHYLLFTEIAQTSLTRILCGHARSNVVLNPYRGMRFEFSFNLSIHFRSGQQNQAQFTVTVTAAVAMIEALEPVTVTI